MQQTVALGKASTELLIGNGSRQRLIELISSEAKRIVIISDQNVQGALRHMIPLSTDWITVSPGEASKSLDVASLLWSKLIEQGHDRSSAILAVGGGMVGDLAGFVASTYLRGVPFYSLPTSLLSMVDASVGGKVGIDLCEGKNLVGQFYPAKVVAVDPEMLTTLPESEWSGGMAEVIKHGILNGGQLWESLADFRVSDRKDLAKTGQLVADAVAVKVGVVQQDPYERTGLRATLNLGHTYGHAIEWCSKYEMGHGQAVALGLLAGLRLSRNLGILEQDFEAELISVLTRAGLPTSLSARREFSDWNEVTKAFDRDKKTKEGKWCFVLPTAVGRVETIFAPAEAMVKQAYSSLFQQEAVL